MNASEADSLRPNRFRSTRLTASTAGNATGAKRLNPEPTRSDSLWLTGMGTGRVARNRTRDPNPARDDSPPAEKNTPTQNYVKKDEFKSPAE